MAEVIESLPWWQENQKEEEGDTCHDCVLDDVADSLVIGAHHFLRKEGQPADRQHISEALLRAAMHANWLPDEVIETFDKRNDAFRNAGN